jgi:hypothetical protein
MNIHKWIGALLITLFLLPMAHAQQITQRPSSTTIAWEQELKKAYQEGELNLDQRIRFAFYAGFKPEKLPASWKLDRFKAQKNAMVNLHCLTETVRLFHQNRSVLPKSTQEEVSSFLSSDLPQSYTSDSGLFQLHYTNSGTDAVPQTDSDNSGVPDYIEHAADYADSTYAHQVGNIGFTDPLIQNQKYQLYFQNLGYYGYTTTNSNGSSTEIYIENDFSGFASNTDPDGDMLGALKVTIAHEFKHAIQYAANDWAGESDRWAEMDATLMEDVTFDNVNDYYNYNTSSYSIFSSPSTTLYPGSYYHATWALYYMETADIQFWVDVWDIIKQNNSDMIPAMTQVLAQSNRDFETTFTENHLWHYASGTDRSPADRGFEERDYYPSAQITEQRDKVPQTPFIEQTVNKLAAHYYDVTPDAGNSGPVYIWFTYDNPLQLGLLGYDQDATTNEQIIPPLQQGYSLLKLSDFDWSTLSRLGIVVANANYLNPNSADYVGFQLGVGDASTIEQFVIGDYDQSGDLTDSDINQLQYRLMESGLFSMAQHFYLDANGSGTITPYDIAQLWSYQLDNQQTVAMDQNGNGRAPDASRFTADGTDTFTYTAPSVSGEATISISKPQSDGMEIDLDVSNGTNQSARSLTFKVRFPSDSLSFQEMQPNAQSADQQKIVTKVTGDTLYVSLIASQAIPDGSLGTLLFSKDKPGDVELTFVDPIINEWDGHVQFSQTVLTDLSDPVAQKEVPQQTRLLANYPNPFNPTTVIPYELQQPASVRLEVYDSSGRLVQTLVNQNRQSAGRYEVAFRADQLSSGLYFYRLTAGSRTYIKKMLYLK